MGLSSLPTDGEERGVRADGGAPLLLQLYLHPRAPPPCHAPSHQQGMHVSKLYEGGIAWTN